MPKTGERPQEAKMSAGRKPLAAAATLAEPDLAKAFDHPLPVACWLQNLYPVVVRVHRAAGQTRDFRLSWRDRYHPIREHCH